MGNRCNDSYNGGLIMSDWSKVLGALTRWAGSYASHFNKEPKKYTMYGQFYVIATYQDVKVYDGNHLICLVFRTVEKKISVMYTNKSQDYKHSIERWLSRVEV